MPFPDRIVLIGFMGSGKTTVGGILGRRLGRLFIDTDALVVQRAGKSVARIFADDGEAGFRDAEAAALQGLARRGGIVVATGGGAPAEPRNAWFFGEGAATFHLRVSLAAARERTWHDRGRPLLQRPDDQVQLLHERRFSLYERLGAGVDTDGRSPLEVAEEIFRILEGPMPSPRPGGGA